MKLARPIPSGLASALSSLSIARITASLLTLWALAGCDGRSVGTTPGLPSTHTTSTVLYRSKVIRRR